MLAKIDVRDVARRIRSALPKDVDSAALHEPRFNGNERRYITDCIDTGWVSYAGGYVKKFEHALAAACGQQHAIAVTSGTVALQVALQVGGLQSGDEVLVPALTFVASANAIVHAGGVPHFVDVDPDTFGICPVALKAHLDRVGELRAGRLHNRQTGRPIAALLPVHVFGHPADMDALRVIADHYGLLVVEDATEALGSRYKDRPCGSLARLGVLSFNGNKVVTTGGGGAVMTDDAELAERMRHLTTTAKQPHRWAYVHDSVAWNFRMPNINAALGLAQLESLDEVVVRKRRLHEAYVKVFADYQGASVFKERAFVRSNYWLIALVLDPARAGSLDDVLAATNDAGLATRPIWTPMHQLPMYTANPRASLPVTDDLARRVINVPSSPFLAA